jgi:mannose-6-phosphate isomerase
VIDADVLAHYRKLVSEHGLSEFELDDRPWGGEFIYKDSQLHSFMNAFFLDLHVEKKLLSTPKLLFIAPGQRFSWQYHHRRGEVWKVLDGPIGVATSLTDEQPEPKIYQMGDVVETKPEERHRIIGQDGWGVVAELWRHADPEHPSTEDDNVRVQDDYDRK